MNDTPAPIPDSLAFVLHRATTLVDRAADLFLRSRHDVSYSLFSVLLLVGASDRPSQREVADMLGVSRASITQRIAELGRRGLVQAVPDATDARAVDLVLTEAGGTLLASAWHDLETAEDGIDAGVDVAGLIGQLQLIIANATRYIDELRSEDQT